ncbi:MAG: bifunctional diaminohydroxyphosphoribosylaminopyrimidine deaminase/5-amino-6-(5-phosphoribosylamino)uracil reductase RibD [Bacteroidales bacterium]
MSKDEKYMRRALQLASKGQGSTSPNPLVGCVIVHDNKVIGEGFHLKAGEAHAEVNAINSVRNKDLLRQSTLYVSLEPCSHHGRTPPCSNLIVDNGIPRVVLACSDPNPLVAGRGIKKLRDSGVKVLEGICKMEAEYLNRRFFTVVIKARPYIILKWAETPNGFIDSARKDKDSPQWLTNEWARTLVHKQRAEEDAIMLGSNTILMDNPSLTVREWSGSHPTRVLIDRNNRFLPDAKVFDNNGARVIYFQAKADTGLPKHISTEQIVSSDDAEMFILQILVSHGINSVIIEGGAKFLSSFIKKGLWDEAFCYIGEIEFDAGTKAPLLTKHRRISSCRVGLTKLNHYVNIDNVYGRGTTCR